MKGRPSGKEQPIETPQPIDHDYCHTKLDTNSEKIKEYLPEIEEQMKHLEKLKEINESMKYQLLSLDNIKEDPSEVQFWTGFPNYETFCALFKYLEPRAKMMHYWRGQLSSNERPENIRKNKPGPERKLTLIEEFFLTVVRLKVGLLTQAIARRFNVSVGTVSSIVTSWINLMYSDLKHLCQLPSKSVFNQSSAMKSFFYVRLILDCTELFVQNPSKLENKKQLFSHYKHHNTFKFLIGTSPQMGVSYVSRMYGGKTSDQYITSDSADLLENLETSKGSIMTDRGFLVHGIMSDMGVKVHMPAFKGTDRCQFTASEAEQSEMISKVRIHVERVIQRFKTYHIFDTELKLSMKDIAEQVFTVCAFLVNFQTPIVK